MLVRAPTRTATFKKADAAAKSKVVLVTKDSKKLSCVVTSVDSAGVAIACPEDSAPEGTEVTETYDWSQVADPNFAAFCPFMTRDDLSRTLANLARVVEQDQTSSLQRG